MREPPKILPHPDLRTYPEMSLTHQHVLVQILGAAIIKISLLFL